ncbi:M23 family metallopeptidase [Croceibacterium ferulae]|uniref:M23 family metallopeptidase n=1 Tax=Croceibacterium ferulae TaxID=1854641 RepID=UPI000EB105D6|nr:M23 family metallopeptidase [Croceibacterium ferulae]
MLHHTSRKATRIQHLFAPREIVLRTGGRDGGGIRTLRLSTRKQIILAGVAGALALGWAGSLAALATSRVEIAQHQAGLAAREATVTGEAAQIARWRAEMDKVAGDLAQRQELLETVAGMLPADAIADQEAAAAARPEEASSRTQRVSAALPQGAALLRLEQRQLALAARLTRYAETRADRAEGAIRALGVDPRVVRANLNKDERQAMGGPLEAFASGADGELTARFERLGSSLTRMAELERSMTRVPQVMPVAGARFSSSFGYRRDPFHGTAALHAGLDFAAPMGSPVLATAGGRVSFVGTKGGYGRTVEITHGNGLMTRYGHLSGWKAKVGDRVRAGDQVGMLGSTGRSTGPHLHFEVRVHGRAVNPMPFLQNAPALLAGVREG